MTKENAVRLATADAKKNNTTIAIVATPSDGYQYCPPGAVKLLFPSATKVVALVHANGNFRMIFPL